MTVLALFTGIIVGSLALFGYLVLQRRAAERAEKNIYGKYEGQ